MPKRLADADSRRFFDEFERVNVSRFRATGVIDPAKRQALIPFPDGTTKLIGVAHTHFKNGGGFSYFICPKCARLSRFLYLIDGAPRCRKCCIAMNIRNASLYGFGQDRRRDADKRLDQLNAKLDTTEPLRLKPAPEAWRGARKLMSNSHRLKASRRRSMVSLRLNQLASQMGSGLEGYQPLAATKQLIDVRPIWRAKTSECLQQALDKAQAIIIRSLKSDDPAKRLAAAAIMMRTKQARDRGW